MTLVELKKSLHDKIDHTNDYDVLEMLNGLIHENDAVFTIPEAHLAGIKRGTEDIKNGNFITIDEFEKRYEKWLKE